MFSVYIHMHCCHCFPHRIFCLHTTCDTHLLTSSHLLPPESLYASKHQSPNPPTEGGTLLCTHAHHPVRTCATHRSMLGIRSSYQRGAIGLLKGARTCGGWWPAWIAKICQLYLCSGAFFCSACMDPSERIFTSVVSEAAQHLRHISHEELHHT